MTFNESKLFKLAAAAVILFSLESVRADDHEDDKGVDNYSLCEEQAKCDEACDEAHKGDRNAIRACEVKCDDKCGDKKEEKADDKKEDDKKDDKADDKE